MATFTVPIAGVKLAADPERMHRIRLLLTAAFTVCLLAAAGLYGWPYYKLGLQDRVHSPLHSQFRSSGSIGILLGIAGAALYAFLFLYAIRKRWKWLGRIGKTRRWLDFHILCGLSAPVLISYHSTFKFGGLAGVAYWIMISVVLSGFVGRYLYSQIPRSLNAAEVTMKELEENSALLSKALAQQRLFSTQDLLPLFEMPTRDQVRRMALPFALLRIAGIDLRRPGLVSALRRRSLSTTGERIRSLYGWLPSGHKDLESVVAVVRAQAWLSARMLFLERAQEIFHLWHVVHRPFSYSFAVLALAHILVVVLLGYY